jgi:general secretion pathway protein G
MKVPTASRKPQAPSRRRAFTLIEAIVVIIIIGVLATLIAPRLIGRIGQAKRSTAESNAAVLASQMKLLMADIGAVPSGAGIEILWEKPGNIADDAWKGPYVDTADDLVDPWGNKYILKIPGDRRPDYDIVSYGQDGKPGGEGEDADIVK